MKLLVINGSLDLRNVASRDITKVRDADVVICAMGTTRRIAKHPEGHQGTITGQRFGKLKREADEVTTIRV